LLGDAEGGFDWSDAGNVKFRLHAGGDENPFEAVMAFLAEADVKRYGPVGYSDPLPKKGKKGDEKKISRMTKRNPKRKRPDRR